MSPRIRVRLALVAVCLLLVPAGALAATPGALMRVGGSCVGNTVSGRVVVRAPEGTVFRLRLLRRRTARSEWRAVGHPKLFRSRGGKQSLRFRFRVSAVAAEAYRLRLARGHHRVFSRPIPLAACAPGHQVPDAPFALLLPLSLLGIWGGRLLLRSRAAR